jgi:hypothetical protein
MLLAALMALPLPATLHAQSASQLPSLGDSASDDLGVGEEKRLGEQIMREVRRDPQYLDDPMLLAYVQSLWQPLVDTARRTGQIGADTGLAFGWEVFLVRDRSVNAFALPGGHVGVHLGLVAMTTSADELASVLAHELSHVTQRHIARSIGSSKRVGMVGLAAILLGVLAASRTGSADAAQAAVIGGQAAIVQGQLNFSREAGHRLGSRRCRKARSSDSSPRPCPFRSCQGRPMRGGMLIIPVGTGDATGSVGGLQLAIEVVGAGQMLLHGEGGIVGVAGLDGVGDARVLAQREQLEARRAHQRQVEM